MKNEKEKKEYSRNFIASREGPRRVKSGQTKTRWLSTRINTKMGGAKLSTFTLF